MKRIFEIDPLECPRCKGQMRIIAFLTAERAILKIADSLRIPRAQAPPKIGRTPPQEFYDDIPPDDFSAWHRALGSLRQNLVQCHLSSPFNQASGPLPH
jgi:hypothetical protein